MQATLFASWAQRGLLRCTVSVYCFARCTPAECCPLSSVRRREDRILEVRYAKLKLKPIMRRRLDARAGQVDELAFVTGLLSRVSTYTYLHLLSVLSECSGNRL
jgi:hypothetical protein